MKSTHYGVSLSSLLLPDYVFTDCQRRTSGDHPPITHGPYGTYLPKAFKTVQTSRHYLLITTGVLVLYIHRRPLIISHGPYTPEYFNCVTSTCQYTQHYPTIHLNPLWRDDPDQKEQ